MMEEVAEVLARHGQRERFTGDQDLVFCDQLGRHLAYMSLMAYKPRADAARRLSAAFRSGSDASLPAA